MQNEQIRTDLDSTYTFRRESGHWYICPDTCLLQGLSREELMLTEGAPRILDVLSSGSKLLKLRIALHPFAGANLLELVEHCAAPKGGGIYLLNPEKEFDSQLYWLCDFALSIFGDIPERIYIKRLPVKDKKAHGWTQFGSSKVQEFKS